MGCRNSGLLLNIRPTGTYSILFWNYLALLNGKTMAWGWGICPSSGPYIWGIWTAFCNWGRGIWPPKINNFKWLRICLGGKGMLKLQIFKFLSCRISHLKLSWNCRMLTINMSLKKPSTFSTNFNHHQNVPTVTRMRFTLYCRPVSGPRLSGEGKGGPDHTPILMLAGCSVLVRLITMHTWTGSQVVPNDRCFEMQFLKIIFQYQKTWRRPAGRATSACARRHWSSAKCLAYHHCCRHQQTPQNCTSSSTHVESCLRCS